VVVLVVVVAAYPPAYPPDAYYPYDEGPATPPFGPL